MLPFFLLALLLPCFFVCCIQFKQLRLLLLYGLSSLVFCFPAFAEDEAYTFESDITEFTYLQNNEIKLNQIEQNIIQDEINNQNQIVAILAEPLADPTPLLTSANDSSADNILTDYRVDLTGEYGFLNIYGSGYAFHNSGSYFIYDDNVTKYLNINPTNTVLYNSGIYHPFFVKKLYLLRSDNLYDTYTVNIPVDQSTGLVSFDTNIYYTISLFLNSVQTVFTWIFSSFSTLTNWILSDSMAAVYAAIFLVGCCIAMLFRVLHSA